MVWGMRYGVWGKNDENNLQIKNNSYFAPPFSGYHKIKGEMQEWFNWHAWKACVPQKGTGGSNPPLSAKPKHNHPAISADGYLFSEALKNLFCKG